MATINEETPEDFYRDAVSIRLKNMEREAHEARKTVYLLQQQIKQLADNEHKVTDILSKHRKHLTNIQILQMITIAVLSATIAFVYQS